MAIDQPAADRVRGPRRIGVTDVETAQVIEHAATRGELRFERRGGRTYLIEGR